MASSRALILHSWAAFAGLGFVHADSPYNNAHDVNSSVPIYKPLFELPSNSTPRYDDASGLLNPIGKSDIGRRQSGGPNGEGTCAPGSPCVNGACCSKTGICGYSPDFCGAENCISNCDAKAQCGQYAVAGKERCPLNVCCVSFPPAGSHLTMNQQTDSAFSLISPSMDSAVLPRSSATMAVILVEDLAVHLLNLLAAAWGSAVPSVTMSLGQVRASVMLSSLRT